MENDNKIIGLENWGQNKVGIKLNRGAQNRNELKRIHARNGYHRAHYSRMLSDDGGFCLTLFGLQELKTDQRFRATLRTDFGDLKDRAFARVLLAGEWFVADAVTGSLYYANGYSASGARMSVSVPARVKNQPAITVELAA